MSQRRSSGTIQAEIRIEEEYKKTLELRKRAQEARKEFEIQAAKHLDMVIEEQAAREARVAERERTGNDLRIAEEYKKAQELRKRAQEARKEYEIQAAKHLDMAHDARVAERERTGDP